jgi:hypothetical protein
VWFLRSRNFAGFPPVSRSADDFGCSMCSLHPSFLPFYLSLRSILTELRTLRNLLLHRVLRIATLSINQRICRVTLPKSDIPESDHLKVCTFKLSIRTLQIYPGHKACPRASASLVRNILYNHAHACVEISRGRKHGQPCFKTNVSAGGFRCRLNPVSVEMPGQYELTSLRSRSPQQNTRSRSSLVAQLWFTRIPAVIRRAVASWSAVRTTQYTLISDIDDTGNHNRDAVHTRIEPTLRSFGRIRVRRLIWMVLIILPSLAVVIILLVAVLYPSYSHPPHHYDVLRAHALISTDPGRINIHNEKIFIASSIYDKQGRLASGPWAQNLLDLIDLLGPENVFLSVFEDDPDSLARTSLKHFSKRVSCGSIQGLLSFITD